MLYVLRIQLIVLFTLALTMEIKRTVRKIIKSVQEQENRCPLSVKIDKFKPMIVKGKLTIEIFFW